MITCAEGLEPCTFAPKANAEPISAENTKSLLLLKLKKLEVFM